MAKFKVELSIQGPPSMAGSYGFHGDTYEDVVSVDLMIKALNLAMEAGRTVKDCRKLIQRAFNGTRFILPKKTLKIKIGRRKK